MAVNFTDIVDLLTALGTEVAPALVVLVIALLPVTIALMIVSFIGALLGGIVARIRL